MGMFISIFINQEMCKNGCKECVNICPVNIFEIKQDKITVVKENEDECTFCNLCLEKCPSGSIEIRKEY